MLGLLLSMVGPLSFALPGLIIGHILRSCAFPIGVKKDGWMDGWMDGMEGTRRRQSVHTHTLTTNYYNAKTIASWGNMNKKKETTCVNCFLCDRYI